MKERIAILSWNGKKDIGGVERVVGILSDIFHSEYECYVVDQDYIFSHWQKLIFLASNHVGRMILLSIAGYRFKRSNYILIGNGFNAPFIYKDFNIAHGTMYDVKKAMKQWVWGGSTMFERISMHNSNRIIAVSNATRDSLIRYYRIKKEKIEVVNNCVDTHRFYPFNNTKREQLTVLFSGRLEERKGIDVLFRFAQWISNRSDVQLIIASNSMDNVDMFTGIRNVTLHIGMTINEMNCFYNSGNVLFVPSKSEGFEMVTLEALAAGIPVVGNKVGAIAELSAQNFEGVYILSDLSMENIFEQLQHAAICYRSNEKRFLLHNKVNEKFGIDTYAKRILNTVGLKG